MTTPTTEPRRPDLARSSGVMAVGTAASRVTGFGRTVVLAAALGTQLLGDAYNTANTIPFVVYDLLIGGLMASVIVPFLVRRRKRDPDGGHATEQRVFTMALIALLVLASGVVLAAEPLIRLYAGEFTDAQFDVAVLLARFLLAQIFFIGLSGVSGALLNTRGRFGAPVWAPVLNNVVIICVGLSFIVLSGPGAGVGTITDTQVVLLGFGTAGAMALQALTLQWALRAAGFRWRPRLDLRDSGLGEALRAAGWMFVLVCTMQTGFLITANIANRAGVAAATGDAGVGAGLTAYNYAYQLFQLPYAVVAVSVITVLLPRMSAYAADNAWRSVRDDFSRGLRTVSVLLVPIALLMAVYAVPLCVLVFARGNTSVEDARAIGHVLTVFALGLVPFTVYQLMLRVFYASGDTRTPALTSLANVAVHAATAVASYWVLPPHRVVMGVAAGFMLSYVCGLLIGGAVLRQRLGGIGGRRIAWTVARLHMAATPSTLLAAGALMLAQNWFVGETVAAVFAMAVGVVFGVPLFLLLGRFLRIEEVGAVTAMVRERMTRSR
ncbi:murein biosynthesis integral membrane protein MurJ [Nocardiopsis tropica]|uniref:Murein biosynthesis integral membrane protein MurJ n=1 Tax=Nocardiopsis tropica TaxID=109330 RepID=A0ABU7KK02_9ACTN|nr:murein biosynthesis integral membrane protein MurJ [Nocardiopsis umidischolae]MEE2049611.1 murein biosynthesis integral membrane protein MurJ [Nocardiopsis umidischolae]